MLETFEKNICDVEVFDGTLSQYFSGLNSLDILVQPLLRVILFNFVGVENTVNNFFDAFYIQIPLRHKAVPLPPGCKIHLSILYFF